MTAHEVRGKDGRGCRFVIVQGIGTHDFIPVGGGIRSRTRPRPPGAARVRSNPDKLL